ncbi:MAG: esterase/lipase family protein, partial [Pirellulales bacterium]
RRWRPAEFWLVIAAVVAMMFTAQRLAADESSPGEHQRISVEQDPDTLTSRVVIEARDGEIAWADLMAGLARAKGYDDDALDGVPRHKSFDLDRRHTRFLLGLMNVFSESSGIRFTILPPTNQGGEPRLQVTLDRRAMLASKRRFEKMLRLSVVDKHAGEEPAPDYGLSWPAADAVGHDRVVVLHGLGSTPEAHASLSADLRRAGLRVGQFAYAGNEPLEDSARLLARELKRLKQDEPDVRLRLVTLSMGGLVARRVLEDASLDAGNVTQLVMVAPPNHGSVLAYCGFGLQVWQFLDDPKARGVAQRFYDTVEDGLSEASDDLRPDSAFLKKLSGLQRNPRVRYSLLLGTGAPLSEHAVNELRQHLAEAKERHRFIQFLGPKIDRILDDPDELTYGKGDGVVAVKRGRLEGVDDTLTLDFHHLSIGQPPQTNGEMRLREEIIKRLPADK